MFKMKISNKWVLSKTFFQRTFKHLNNKIFFQNKMIKKILNRFQKKIFQIRIYVNNFNKRKYNNKKFQFVMKNKNLQGWFLFYY